MIAGRAGNQNVQCQMLNAKGRMMNDEPACRQAGAMNAKSWMRSMRLARFSEHGSSRPERFLTTLENRRIATEHRALNMRH
jgi:hypothetical protein